MRIMLLITIAISRLMKFASFSLDNCGPLRANKTSGKPIAASNIPRINIPLDGSDAKLCTEVSSPERTMNVPTKDSEKDNMAKSTVQLFS